MIARPEKQAHLRVAEAIDGLHGIADDEERASIALLPCGGERFEQLELRERGVLELVDQDVLEREPGAQRELRRLPGLGERRARRARHVRVIDAAAVGELGVQLERRARENARQRRDRRLVRCVERCGKAGSAPEELGETVHAAESLDARAQRRACSAFLVGGAEPSRRQPLPPVPARERARGEALPRSEVRGILSQRADTRQLLRGEPQRARQPRKNARELPAHHVAQARVDSRTELPGVAPEHVAQPVCALLEHLGEEPLDQDPLVVEALEEQRRIGAERRVMLGGEERAARGAPVELIRRLGDLERAAGARGDRQLAREPVGEGVDGLNSQSLRVLLEAAAARACVLPRRFRQPPKLRRAGLVRPHLPAQRADHPGAHLGGGLAREGDREDRTGIVHRGEQPQEALGEDRGLAGAGRGLQQDRAALIERAHARLEVLALELISHRPSPGSGRRRARGSSRRRPASDPPPHRRREKRE